MCHVGEDDIGLGHLGLEVVVVAFGGESTTYIGDRKSKALMEDLEGFKQ